HGNDEDAGDDIGDAVVEPHDAHPGGRAPALGIHPVAVGGHGDRAADAADQAERIEGGPFRNARHQAGNGFADVRANQDGHPHDDHEHHADADLHGVLEDLVAVERHEGGTGETGDHRPG